MLTSDDGRYRRTSLWFDDLPGIIAAREGLPGDRDADVAIVGAGFTGLWTAFHLLRADPTLRIVLLEQEIAGSGASGRSGGWCSGLVPTSLATLRRIYGPHGALALVRSLQATVDAIGDLAAAEGIDCRYVKSGSLTFVRNPAQLQRARADIRDARSLGLGDDDVVLLSAAEARAACAASRVLAATFTPHCAALDPARLAIGLAEAIERRGARIFEGTAVTGIEPRRVVTDRGVVRADIVVRATEGFTAGLSGLRRELAPIYSLMIATEQLSAEFWANTGLTHRQTFADHRHLIIYGQRTADGRIAFGGRGAPYHFGSRVQAGFDRNPRVLDGLRRNLVELFPALTGVRVTHAWGGPLGVSRDWCTSVAVDRRTGIAHAGGYAGRGVGASALAAQSLAGLILGCDTEAVRLPWVGHHSGRWEPEPLRWLGVNANLRIMASADAAERRRPRPARRAALARRAIGL
jgi:glycine/D-amino acid oxidase-like deaminating enzyme